MSFRSIITGTAMMSAVRMLRLVAQFITIPILSRLLSPDQYGLMAIAMPFALFAMMLADAGIGTSLVRTPSSERTVWSTCFWASVILGIMLTLIMAALGPLAARIFDEPQLIPMLGVLSVVVLAQSVHLVPVAALQQGGRFQVIAAVEIVATAASLASAIAIAHQGGGAWALIWQQVVYFAVRVTGICFASPFRPQLVFAWAAMREHFHFGRNVFASNLVNYCTRSVDVWVIGKVLGTMALGFYTMAFQFARLPTMLVSGPLNFVAYAKLAAMRDNTAAIGRVFLLITRLLAIVIFPAMALVAAAHAPLFSLLLSDKWQFAGYLFLLVAPATAMQTIAAVGEPISYALGRSDVQFRSSCEYCVLWLVTLLLAVSHGVEAAAMAYCVCGLLYHVRYTTRILVLLKLPLRPYFATYAVPMLVTAAALVMFEGAVQILALNDWLSVAMAAVLAISAMAAGFLLQRTSIMREIGFWNQSHARALGSPLEAATDGGPSADSAIAP